MSLSALTMIHCLHCFLLLAALPGIALAASCQPDAQGRGAAPSSTSFTWSTQAEAAPSSVVPRYKIALWGDSLTSSRDFLDAALAAAGIAREQVRPSFIPAGMKTPGLHLPLRAACTSPGWQVEYAHKQMGGQSPFAKGFMRMRADAPGEVIALDFRYPASSTRVRELTLLYDKPAPDSSLLLGIAVNDGMEKLVRLSGVNASSLHLRPDAPMANVRIRLVSGAITVHGFVPIYTSPADVVVDAMSIPGGMMRSWLHADPALFAAGGGQDGAYSLILLQYGTNEGADPQFSASAYRLTLRTQLHQVRSLLPRSRCVLIGPPDRGVVGSSGPPAALKFAAIHQQIALAQREIGRQFRCEFWDWQTAMGGPGSAAAWARMTPPQMQADLTHLTAPGYRISGALFGHYLNLDQQ